MNTYIGYVYVSLVNFQFMPVVIGQNSDDQISLYFMDPNPFVKSLTGKPKLK